MFLSIDALCLTCMSKCVYWFLNVLYLIYKWALQGCKKNFNPNWQMKLYRMCWAEQNWHSLRVYFHTLLLVCSVFFNMFQPLKMSQLPHCPLNWFSTIKSIPCTLSGTKTHTQLWLLYTLGVNFPIKLYVGSQPHRLLCTLCTAKLRWWRMVVDVSLYRRFQTPAPQDPFHRDHVVSWWSGREGAPLSIRQW